MELWNSPWALLTATSAGHRIKLEAQKLIIGSEHRSPLLVYDRSGHQVLVNGSETGGEQVRGFDHSEQKRRLLQAPLPLKSNQPLLVSINGVETQIEWSTLPERPAAKHIPQTDSEKAGHELFLRAFTVWDRLLDVDAALSDPANLWTELRRRWTNDDLTEPQMDIIVRHAVKLKKVIDFLERLPRRILRRTHKQVPLSRVQELDRRSMTWLIRQPGHSLAERAGDRQAILAVAREENFDTLENRVLRSYCELASFIATDYIARNKSKYKTRRAILVDNFGRRCKRLGRELQSCGVRLADPGTLPNFVLQQNPQYHQVWEAWGELLNRESVMDDLWRWQGRSWEEYCALAVMVALIGISGAKLVASAPLIFRSEQTRGRWLQHDNPLGAFYLEKQGLVVEVRFDMSKPGAERSDFAAPIWVSFGRVGDVSDFLSYVAIWPIWDHKGGLVAGEASEVAKLLKPFEKKTRISAAVIMRPPHENTDLFETEGSVLSVCLDTQGAALQKGLERLSIFFESLLTAGVKR